MSKRADRASRTKKKKTADTTTGKTSGKTSGRTLDETAGEHPLTGTAAGVEERGAFAIARCDRCGWQGSARRSRDRARKDLKQHLDDKPKHADHMSLEDVAR